MLIACPSELSEVNEDESNNFFLNRNAQMDCMLFLLLLSMRCVFLCMHYALE